MSLTFPLSGTPRMALALSLIAGALLTAPVALSKEDTSPVTPQADVKVDWSDTQIDEVLTAAKNASSKANTIAQRIENGFQHLTGLEDIITEAVGDLKNLVQDLLDGRDAFLGNNCDANSDCGKFRDDLVGLIEGVTNITNALYGAAPVSLQTDFSALTGVAENAPGRALYPIYRVLALETPIANAEMVDSMTQLAEDVEFLALALQGSLAGTKVVDIDQCAILLDDFPEVTRRATQGASGFGILFILSGHGLVAAGETHLEAKAGVHGYPGILVKNNLRKKAGNFMAGVGKGLTQLSSAVSGQVQQCIMTRFQEETLQNQLMILANQQKIWSALPPGWTRGEELVLPVTP